jgi:hypothetical protein
VQALVDEGTSLGAPLDVAMLTPLAFARAQLAHEWHNSGGSAVRAGMIC